MPHVMLHLAAGRSDAEKRLLADALADAVTAAIGSPAESISVAIEDVPMDDWPQFYRREIAARPALLFKPPGYTL